MEIFYEILNKLLFLYSFILMGFILSKTLRVGLQDISKILIYLVTPAVVFFAGYKVELNSAILLSPFIIFLIFFILSYLTFYILSIFISDKRKRILPFLCVDKNTGYLGLPIAMFLFDESVVSMYIVTLIGGTIAESSIGLYMLSRGKYNIKQSLIKVAKIPLIYALLLGLILNTTNTELSSSLMSYELYFKYTYTFLGMFIIGVGLAQIKNLKFGKLFIFIPIIGSYIVYPLFILGFIYIDDITINLLNSNLEKVFLLISIMPIAANVIPFATLFNYDTDKVSFALVLSTILALFYIPVMIHLLGLA